MKNLKIYLLLLGIMILVIIFNITNYNSNANDNSINETYENFSNQIENVKQLDNEEIEEYGEFVDIVDGKYIFSYNGEDNEETLFIKQNIESINDLLLGGYAKLDGDDVILENDDELYAQFGVSNVKWKWFGLNFKMDREMMVFVSIASLAVRALGGYVKNLILNGKLSTNNLNGMIMKFINSNILSDTTYKTYCLRTLNKSIILLDEKKGNVASTVEGLITAGIATLVTMQTALACSTGGISAIITQVLNYILGLFMPSYVDAFCMILGGGFGLYKICNAQIRWFKGFGGYYSYM